MTSPVKASASAEQRTFWGELGDENLRHTDPDDAIEEIIDGMHPAGIDDIGLVTVHEFAPMKVTASWLRPLESMLEALDEEYSSPDGDGTRATDAMLAAEAAFIAAVIAEYEPWMHEPTGKTITVNAKDWVRERCPEWLPTPKGLLP